MRFSPFEERLKEHVLKSPAPGKHAARSAMRHLERAWKLKDEMPEVALFLGITAEEESATAVFCALKRRHYEGSKHLNPRNHVHKTALHPFLLAIGQAVRDFAKTRSAKFVFDTENSPDGVERLRILFQVVDDSGRKWDAWPLPPLNFSVSVDRKPHDFSAELRELAIGKHVKDIHAHVKRLANRRNEVLYASAGGIPHAEGAEEFLQYRKAVVISHLMTYLLVDQSAEKQLFAQQALDAFVQVMHQLSRNDV